MVKKYRSSGTSVALSVLCSIAFSIVICLLFIAYGKRVDHEFQRLEEENLTEHAVSQSRQVDLKIKEVMGRMRATARLVISAGLDPEGERFSTYLREVSGLADYRVNYVTIGDLQANLGASGSYGEDEAVLEQLLNGESVISELRYSNRLNGYYFALAEPVIRDGQTVGALRSVMEAGILTDYVTENTLHETYEKCIIDRDGIILYNDENWEGVGKNLFDCMGEDGVRDETLALLRQAVREDESVSVKVRLPEKNVFYVTAASLGYNDWSLVKFARTEKVNHASRQMMRYTVFLTAVVMILMASAGILLFYLIYRQKKRILLDRARYDTFADFSGMVLFEYSFRMDTLEFSPNVKEFLPIENPHINKLTGYQFKVLHPEDVRTLMNLLRDARKTRTLQKAEFRCLNHQNVYFWCECRCQMLDDCDENDPWLIGTLIDISDRKEKELDLLKKTKSDAMTGLLNKNAMEIAVDSLIRQHNSGFLFMIDLDNFKLVNDTHGHGEGDNLLMRVSDMLKSIFRENDPVARVGGDEFLVYMTDTQSVETARLKAASFFEKLSLLGEEKGYPVSVSIGIAGCPRDGRTFQLLYESADQAMYQAKKSGKHGFAFTDGLVEE